jgi:hypothetical protein
MYSPEPPFTFGHLAGSFWLRLSQCGAMTRFAAAAARFSSAASSSPTPLPPGDNAGVVAVIGGGGMGWTCGQKHWLNVTAVGGGGLLQNWTSLDAELGGNGMGQRTSQTQYVPEGQWLSLSHVCTQYLLAPLKSATLSLGGL